VVVGLHFPTTTFCLNLSLQGSEGPFVNFKKFKIEPKNLIKAAPGFLIVGVYWYWVNQRIIAESDPTFGLFGFFLLICVATAYFPLPANIIVLGAVKNADPLLVAFVGGCATLFAYLSEYLVFTLLFKSQKIAGFKNSWVYKQAAPLFDRHKFIILSFATFLPIPSEPLRIYAITTKYSIPLFMLAGFVGRLPRYYLLGYYGKDYVNSVWFLAAVFIFPALLLLAIKGVVALAHKLHTHPESETDLAA